MKEPEIIHRYRRGEVIPSEDFNTPEGLKFFGETVWLEHKKEHVVAQRGLLDNETYWRKVRPSATAEQEFLKRPTDVQRKVDRTNPEDLLCQDDKQRLMFARELLRQEMGK